MITYRFLLLGTLLISAIFGEEKPCTLKVFEEGSSQLIEDICLVEYVSNDCRPFVRSFNKSDLPLGFPLEDTDYSVEKPKTIELTPKLSPYVTDTRNDLIPGLLINWSSPVSKNARQNIKGYLMIWEKKEAKPGCRLFKFNNTKQDTLLRELNFQYDVAYISPNTPYQVRVYSIPPPDDWEKSQDGYFYESLNITSGSTVRNFKDPWSWTPSLSARPIGEGAIEVKVGRSPERFNLTIFEVLLLQFSVDELNYIQNKTIVSPTDVDPQNPVNIVHFTGLKTDKYKIVVKVKDTYWKQDGKCLCWEEERHGRFCRLNCGSIETDWFDVDGLAPLDLIQTTGAPALSPEVQATTPSSVRAQASLENANSDLSSKEIKWIIGVSVPVVVIAVVMAVLARRAIKTKKKKFSSFHEQSPPNQPPALPRTHVQIPKNKSVFILFAEDDPAHVNFVMTFANFLKTHCYCHVVYPSAEVKQIPNQLQWSRSAIDSVDHILFMDSEAAEQYMASYSHMQGYVIQEEESQGNKLFRFALADIFIMFPRALDKLVVLYHRKECGDLPRLRNRAKLQLPSELPALLQMIHNLNETEAMNYSENHTLPMCLDNIGNIQAGADLLSALQELGEMKHTHPSPVQRLTSVVSDDTGVFSNDSAHQEPDARETEGEPRLQALETEFPLQAALGHRESDSDSGTLMSFPLNYLYSVKPHHEKGQYIEDGSESVQASVVLNENEETRSSFERALECPFTSTGGMDFAAGLEDINC